MQKPINLDHVARLAEHLDAIGERQAAIIVRAALAQLREGEVVPYESLLRFASELVHDTDVQLEHVREVIAHRLSAQQCWVAAGQGGGAVAELLDTVIVMTVTLLAPHTHVSRGWPVVGEPVVRLSALPCIADSDSDTLAANTGVVAELDTAKRRVRVQWPAGERWVDMDEIAAVRTWR